MATQKAAGSSAKHRKRRTQSGSSEPKAPRRGSKSRVGKTGAAARTKKEITVSGVRSKVRTGSTVRTGGRASKPPLAKKNHTPKAASKPSASATPKASSAVPKASSAVPKASSAKAPSALVNAPNTKASPAATRPTNGAAKPAQPTKNAVETARRHLCALASIVEQADDRDAEQILGEGRLEALLKAVLPARKRSAKTTYDYLASQKRRASLMAQLRHSINTTYSFATDLYQDRFLSPTRVQWFYDGLTFIEGSQPFSGVVGLYRNGQLSYGLDVSDATENASLGPSEADFVSLQAAEQSFAAASKPAPESTSDLSELTADKNATAERWATLVERYPWLFGAQHLRLVRIKQDDPSMPSLFCERVDGAHDVLLLGQAATPIFGKAGRMQRSFQELLQQAEQTLSFVKRQATYLEREFGLSIRRPRAFVVAGGGLSNHERALLRHHAETRHAELRVLTFDDLAELARKTRAFFEARLARSQ